MPVTNHVTEMIATARLLVESISVAEAAGLRRLDAAILIDVRDIRELHMTGTVPDAFHAPRGMLEFWVDPESRYFKDIFGTDKRFVLHCASGWRSALSAKIAMEMGLKPVAHIEGGFSAWKKSDGEIELLD